MAFQLATLIVSAVTLSQSGEPNPAPPLLTIVVTMELVVQIIEILWYGTVGALYYFGQMSIGVRYRYYDWVVTTPVGLIGLIIFVWYLECQSATTEILGNASRIITIIIIVLADWAMLAIGYVYEAEIEWATKLLDRSIAYIPLNVLKREGMGLVWGWLPFLALFVPMFIALGTANPSDNSPWAYAILVVLATFVTWALYGVVAFYFRTPAQAKLKNASYNLLDIVSKNIVGLVTSIVALQLTNSGSTAIPWNATVCNATSA